MKAMFKLSTIAATLLFSFSATADNSARDALMHRLQGLSTLSADFTQKVTDPSGEMVQQLHGHMKLARPNYLYWQTDAPDETLMVADGNNLWYYNPFIEQVTLYSQTEAMTQSPLLVLLDADTDAWANYRVKMEANSFALQPLDEAAYQQSLQLVFAEGGEQAAIQKIILDDGQGQISTIELENLVLNQALPKKQFEFTVPEGVDVDDQR